MAEAPEFTPAVHSFLEAPDRFGVLSTINRDGTPHQAVIWYTLRGDLIVINSMDGRIWPTNLRRDPRCSMVIEDGWNYVALRGSVEVIEDPEQGQADIAEMARRYWPEDAEERIETRFKPQPRVSFHLKPSSIVTHGDLE